MKTHSIPLLEIQSFQSAFTNFKNKIGDAPSVREPLNLLQKVFSQPVKLQSPRQIYPIYVALTIITSEVANRSIEDLNNAWRRVLTTLNQRKIYRIKLGVTSFETSTAQAILTHKLDRIRNTITASSIDLNDSKNRIAVVNYILKTDLDAFGGCFQRGFVEHILKSPDVKCFAARNSQNEIVGILWGFSTQYQSQLLFHFWELSRSPSMANMGIARRLIDCAKQQLSSISINYVTLNVDNDNIHAKKIYDAENFKILTAKNKKAEKTFMVHQIISNERQHLTPEASKVIVKKFVLKTVPIYKLIYYELVRRCELIWRHFWYN